MTLEEQALHVAGLCGFGASVAESLYRPVASATRGVWRVGPVVVKVLQPVVGGGAWRADIAPEHPYYWRREAAFYESGVTFAGLAAPRCHGVVDLPDGAVGLCLADVAPSRVPSPWPVETFERVARGAASLVGVRSEGWGSRGWLAEYVARRGTYDADLLRCLDALPRALCHFDFSVQNVFPASDPPTVIDWAFAGDGAVGTDVGPLAVESVLDFHLPPGDVDEVAARTHDAYVAAVDAPEDVVRFGLAAGTAVKFAWIAPAVERARAERPATLNKRPLDEALPIWEATLPHIAAQAATARRLAASLGFS